MGQILCPDTLASIMHADFHLTLHPPGLDFDGPAGGCMPQCIPDQIVKHPSNRLCIHEDRIHPGMDLPIKLDAIPIRQLGKAFKRIRYQVTQ